MVSLGKEFSVQELDELQPGEAEYEISTVTRGGRSLLLKVSLSWEAERGGPDKIKETFRLCAFDENNQVASSYRNCQLLIVEYTYVHVHVQSLYACRCCSKRASVVTCMHAPGSGIRIRIYVGGHS